jgi:hypothetical protein
MKKSKNSVNPEKVRTLDTNHKEDLNEATFKTVPVDHNPGYDSRVAGL